MSEWQELWLHTAIATMDPEREGRWGAIRDGALAVRDGRIAWLGRMIDLPGRPEALATRVWEGQGLWMTPGLIDPHTHLVFGGDRADEFEARLRGESYEEIAARGGGIRSTVRATREADEQMLLRGALPRAEALVHEGVTTLEVKSGYGLDSDTETRMLRVARTLGERLALDVRGTFLGAHTVPDEFEGDGEGFVDYLVRETLPRVVQEGTALQADAFLEEDVGLGLGPVRRFLEEAGRAGLGLRLHADQRTDGEGARLAAELGAASADHLEYASEAGVRAMAAAGVTAVLLPGAFLELREERPPPVDHFREQGVPMALGTDLNPGTSPHNSLLLTVHLGCVLFGLTPAEALAGVTREAARALELDDRGVLREGLRADLALWRVDDPAELAYWAGRNPLAHRVFGGEHTEGVGETD